MFNFIQSALNQIETLTGKHWLHEQVEMIRDTDPRNSILTTGGRRENLIHPLAAAWLAGREELAMAELTGARRFSEKTASIALLGEIMARLTSLYGFKEQIERLMDNNLYEMACCELVAAHGYLVEGWKVKFDAPDLLINAPVGEPEEEIVVRNYFIDMSGSKNPASEVGDTLRGIPDPGQALVAWFHKAGSGEVYRQGALQENCPLETAKKQLCNSPFVSAVVLAQYQRLPGSAITIPARKIDLAVNDSPRYPLPAGFTKTFFQTNTNAPGS